MAHNFGLGDVEVKFFTPEEAKLTVGAKPGFNAVYRISETRVRYELLKPMKGGVVAPVESVVVAETPVEQDQPEQVEAVQAPVEEVTEPEQSAETEPKKTGKGKKKEA